MTLQLKQFFLFFKNAGFKIVDRAWKIGDINDCFFALDKLILEMRGYILILLFIFYVYSTYYIIILLIYNILLKEMGVKWKYTVNRLSN